MNWNSVRFDWNHIRGFLATVEEGSLSAGARVLGMTQPTLSRQISALEQSLGVTLFERGHRSSELTTAGLELVEHVRDMYRAATHISLAASGQSQTIKGHVKLTCTNNMATYHLPPILKRLRAKAPDIEIELVTSNDVRDLKKREADIAIRHGRPDQPDLIAKRIGETTAYFYASTDYLNSAGRPRTVEDFSAHDFIGFETATQLIPYLKEMGIHLTRENFKIYSESGTAIIGLVRQGLGLAILSENDVCDWPELEQILPEYTAISVPYWLVTHRELHTSRRIRLVYDHLSEELKALLRE
jgi:DNA-binding transcriptional LysR family regulator